LAFGFLQTNFAKLSFLLLLKFKFFQHKDYTPQGRFIIHHLCKDCILPHHLYLSAVVVIIHIATNKQVAPIKSKLVFLGLIPQLKEQLLLALMLRCILLKYYSQ